MGPSTVERCDYDIEPTIDGQGTTTKVDSEARLRRKEDAPVVVDRNVDGKVVCRPTESGAPLLPKAIRHRRCP